MGYSQLFAQGWSWGNLLAEGIAGFLFALLLIVGNRLIENYKGTPLVKRALLGLTILVVVLVSSLTSLGISELYRKSSGAPILTPIFGLFYGFVIGSYSTVGTIIGAQIIGSFVGFLLAMLLRPRLKADFKKEEPLTWRATAWRGLAIVFLLVSVGVLSLINPTSYGGTAVLKIVIMALILGGFVTVFGGADFYTYTSFYQLLPMFMSIKMNAVVNEGSRKRGKVPSEIIKKYRFVTVVYNQGESKEAAARLRMEVVYNRHLQSVVFQFIALGLLVGVFALVQVFPGAGSISNVI